MATFMEKMVEAARERRMRVVQLRQAGLTFAEIAGALKISRPAAARLWKEAIRKAEVV